jgi:hypothetical protein
MSNVVARYPIRAYGSFITGRKQHANKIRASVTERRIRAPAYKAQERIMLKNLSEQIRDCLNHAEDCAQKAAELPDGSSFRQDFLRLEKRWLELARSFEFGESLDSFTKNSARPIIKPSVN